jgi:hypothetical protein
VYIARERKSERRCKRFLNDVTGCGMLPAAEVIRNGYLRRFARYISACAFTDGRTAGG